MSSDQLALTEDEEKHISRRRSRKAWASYSGTAYITGSALIMGAASIVPLAIEPKKLPNAVYIGAIIIAVILGLFGIFDTIRQGSRIAKLMKEHAESASRARSRSRGLALILEQSLMTVMDSLEIDFTRARITVYKHMDNSFCVIGRTSRSQQLQSVRRQSYSDDQGFIATVWDVAEGVLTNRPASEDIWIKACVASHIPAEEAKKIRMKSRSLVGKRIDVDGHPRGLMIVESLEPYGVVPEMLDAIKQSGDFRLLSLILENSTAHMDAEDAKEFRAWRGGEPV